MVSNLRLWPGAGWMRIAPLTLALLVAVPAGAQTVNDNMDRGRGERTIAYTADGSRDPSQPVFAFNASLGRDASSRVISLAFVASGDDPGALVSRFSACHDLRWTVDGQPLPAAPASHHAQVIDGELIEMIEQQVTNEWVATLGAAQTARYRVCRNEYALTPSDLHAFATIAAKLKNAARVSSRSAAGVSAPAPSAAVQYQGMTWRPTSADSLFRTKN